MANSKTAFWVQCIDKAVDYNFIRILLKISELVQGHHKNVQKIWKSKWHNRADQIKDHNTLWYSEEMETLMSILSSKIQNIMQLIALFAWTIHLPHFEIHLFLFGFFSPFKWLCNLEKGVFLNPNLIWDHQFSQSVWKTINWVIIISCTYLQLAHTSTKF